MTVEVHYVHIYKDKGNEWRWRGLDSNYKVVADSGEGYRLQSRAMEAARSLFPDANWELRDE